MAGRGPAPKDPDKRLGHHKPEQATELRAENVGRAPKLAGRSKLCAEARRWWDTWVDSAQAAQFIATDWLHLELLVRLVDDFYRADTAKARKELAGEIRLAQAKLGGTPEDRLRLRWRLAANERKDDAVKKTETAKRTSRGAEDPRLKLVGG